MPHKMRLSRKIRKTSLVNTDSKEEAESQKEVAINKQTASHDGDGSQVKIVSRYEAASQDEAAF